MNLLLLEGVGAALAEFIPHDRCVAAGQWRPRLNQQFSRASGKSPIDAYCSVSGWMVWVMCCRTAPWWHGDITRRTQVTSGAV